MWRKKKKGRFRIANTQILIFFRITWSFLILTAHFSKFKFKKKNPWKFIIALKAQLNYSPKFIIVSKCVLILPRCARVCLYVFVLRPLLFSFHSFLPYFQETDEISKKLDNEEGLIFEKNNQGNQNGIGENTKVLEGERDFFI